MKKIVFSMLAASLLAACSDGDTDLMSPNGKIQVMVAENGTIDVFYQDSLILDDMPIGLKLSSSESATPQMLNVSGVYTVNDDYMMPVGKRSHCTNSANERTYTFGSGPAQYDVTIRAYDDGLAIRYVTEAPEDSVYIYGETTAYPIADGTKRWAQTYEPDSYEAFFPLSTDGKADNVRNPNQWGYPLLAQVGDSAFMLITEANIERHHSASYLDNRAQEEMYAVKLADDSLGIAGIWTSPWRVAIIGSLADVVESTLVTDLSNPSVAPDAKFNPGPVSWIYWANNHGSNDYDIIKRYSDLAKDMDWEYVLIDAEWDEMKAPYTVEDAIKYAENLNVKPMLWYNSSVGWVDGAPTPKYRLNDKADRDREYAWLDSLGVSGIKIDFFNGDKAATMDYYIDLLEDALAHNLMVTLHGATVPRGWQRTYPNMMTVEGVYGAEWYNNNGRLTDRAAAHNATLPFTRNVIGPMDYTPGTFTDSQHPHITSHGHELALYYLFESPLQHMPDRPEAYLTLPDDIRQLLMQLPTTWDDTKLLGGYPGEWVALARQKGDKWYIAAINGSDEPTTLNVDLTRLNTEGRLLSLYADGEEQRQFAPTQHMEAPTTLSVPTLPRGGFVAVIE